MTGTGTTGSNGPNWKKRESLGSALVQVAVVAVVLGAIVFLIISRGNTKKAVNDLLHEGRTVAVKANPADLHKGLKFGEEALAKDSKAPDVLAFMAGTWSDLWLEHREPGAEAKAKEYLEQAKKADSKSEDRYGTEAMVMLAGGNAKGAEEFVEELRKKGASSAKLFYAQAMALKAQGNLVLSHTGFTTAMDKAWKNPDFASAWGEALLEEGATGSLDAFNKALGANPENFRARLGIALSRVVRKDHLGDAEAIVKDVLGHDAELSPPLKARAIAINALLANVQSQPDQAITLADQATSLNPDDVWALFAKASALAAKKDAGAGPAFDAVIARAKSAPVFYFEGARALQAAGAFPAALALLDRYEAFFKTVKNPTSDGKEVAFLDRDDRYWLTRGDVLRDGNKLDEAMAAYDKAIEAKNLMLTRAVYAKASVFIARKDFDKAGALLVDITPPDGSGMLPEAYQAMGEVLFAKKAWGEGCQNYAYALSKMKLLQAPREQMNTLLTDVEKKLKGAGQAPVAKLWLSEAKPLIQ
jgi:tetratricopeptide (TPR) repeat protein